MSNKKWTIQNIPDQINKTVIITGATSGLGKEATRVLTKKNATVIMAVRNTEKAKKVATEICSKNVNAKIDIRRLDLGSLNSIKLFTEGVLANYKNIDILINNAGVMMCPYSKTKDGFEIQMGTNHLGHFAITGLLMPLLLKTKKSRIVATSSVAHKQGNIDFTDINWENRKYNTNQAYNDSKLANLYFAYELERRYADNPRAPIITASHPGWTKTELDRHSGLASFFGNIVAQTVQMGTLPTLRAAIDSNVKSSDYFGPSGIMEMRGYPVLVKPSAMSRNEDNAKKLWDLSEELTNIKY